MNRHTVKPLIKSLVLGFWLVVNVFQSQAWADANENRQCFSDAKQAYAYLTEVTQT